MRRLFYIAMLLTPAQIKPKSFESRRNFFSFFFTRGGCVSCLRVCWGSRLLPQSYQYINLSEGADCVDGQLRGDRECPFSGVTKSGRVWRKVPESDARSVLQQLSQGNPQEPLDRHHRRTGTGGLDGKEGSRRGRGRSSSIILCDTLVASPHD